MRARLPHVALFAVVAASPLACSSAGGEKVASGTLEAALTATGPDGATYALPQGSFLQLLQQGTGSAQGLYFNSTSATQSFSLPAAAYNANLFNQNGTSTGWTLTRIADAGATSVAATFADTNPYSFTIATGQTTPLVFHFLVGGVGNVTFTSGTLATSLQVDAGTSPAHGGQFAGSASFWRGNYNGTAAFNSLMQVTSNVTSSFSMAVTLTGAFAMNADQACAPYTATVTATSSHAGVQANLNELSGGTGQLCIGDQNTGNQVTLNAYRTGTANTAAMKAVLSTPAQFAITWAGTSPTPLFDGTTLSLSKLSGATPLTIGAIDALMYVYDANGNLLAGTYGTGNDTAALSITP